jgi:hypothetical protein
MTTPPTSQPVIVLPAAGDAAACCGGPAPAGVDACCVKDAEAKAAGDAGCGCAPVEAKPEPTKPSGCCG